MGMRSVGKVYFFVVLAVALIGLAIASFIGGNYWQGAGELIVGLLGGFVAFGTYNNLKTNTNKH